MRLGWPAPLRTPERRELAGLLILILVMPLFQLGLSTIWAWLRAAVAP